MTAPSALCAGEEVKMFSRCAPVRLLFVGLVAQLVLSSVARADGPSIGGSSPAFRSTAAAVSGSSYYTLRICRLVDTRNTPGPRGGPVLSAGAPRNFAPYASCGTSPTARAISINIAVTQPTSDGFLQLYPVGSSTITSAINFRAGQTRANNAIVPLGSAGDFTLFGNLSGSVHVIIDIYGYFDDPANNQPPTASAGPPRTITLPATATLNGSVSDDGKPNPPGALTITWSKVSGPGSVTFSPPNAASTTASFSAPGIYVLRLSVSDSQLSASDDVLIIVNPQSTANPQADIVRFLDQATWGPDNASIARVQALGITGWLNEQFSAPASSYATLPPFPNNVPVGCNATCQRDNYSMYPLQNRFFTNALYGPDQLRQRVAWVLHKILVISGRDIRQPSRVAPYVQLIDRNAFGNFRDLLYQITLNAGMGRYLDMATSTVYNPNENYAREILQLFTVGTERLNQDGTRQLDSSGRPIPTYDQRVVNGFAKVFTGWSFGAPPAAGFTNYIDPMVLTASDHDPGSKQLLNGATLPGGGDAYQELNAALDNIFLHPNVGPFIGWQLIHALVTSNPSPAYVSRVTAAFNDNGSGVRGDIKAVVSAILLDPEARGDFRPEPGYGRLKEPVQLVTNLLRAFNARSADGSTTSDGYLNPQASSMDQSVFRPPTVFSYYPADYLLPRSATLLGPEFGILSAASALKRANVVDEMVFSGVPVSADAPRGTSLDFSAFLPLASNPATLVAELNRLMMHGTLSVPAQSVLIQAISAVASSNPRLRVQQAVYLVASASQYQVQR